MTSVNWSLVLSGSLLLGYAVIGLFFLRYWRKTGDRLFGIFAIAFWVLMIERFLLLIVDASHEDRPYIYSVRLVAFLLIIIAIIDKNRR